uniref:Potassium channel domain-containing protein n=1 Tax=Chaetoceros debilis TaxID=122233 RepID=A0A7S3VE58_9STRA
MTSKQEALLKPSSTEEKVDEKYSHRRFGRKPTNEKENGIANKVAHGGFTAHGYSDFSSSRKAMLMSIAAFLLYTIIGTVVFANWVDGWSTVDALYYTVATFTTVGYGDISPVTPGQRVFGIFFAIFGIIVLGNVALGIVFDQLINSFQKARKENANSTKRNLMNKFEQKSMSNSSMKNGLGSDDGKSEGKHPNSSSLRKEASPLKEEEKEQRLWLNSITNLVLVAVGIILPAAIIGIIEGWPVIDILYFASITATTIGYGDLSPQTLSTRLIAAFYLPLCISIMAKIFSYITAKFMEKRAQEAEDTFYN